MNAAPKIMKLLIEENKKRSLTDTDKIKLITLNFLMDQKLGDQHFLKSTENTFSLSGYEGNVYVFVLKFDDRDVHFKVSIIWILINAFRYVRNESSLVNFRD